MPYMTLVQKLALQADSGGVALNFHVRLPTYLLIYITARSDFVLPDCFYRSRNIFVA